MKPNEKAEDEVDDRDKKKKKKRKKKTRGAQCLPVTGRSGQTKKQTKKLNSRRRIPRKRRRNPATTGIPIRHTNQILPRLGSAPRCSASRCAEHSASERSPSSRYSCDARRYLRSCEQALFTFTLAIGGVGAFVFVFIPRPLLYLPPPPWVSSVFKHGVPQCLRAQ